jgi:TonB family protein
MMQHKSYNRFSILGEDEQLNATLTIPWDKNTAIGLGVSIAFCTLILLIFLVKREYEESRYIEIGSVPTEILNFGMGDGTGLSAGNLTKEGARKKGNTPPSNLHDAEQGRAKNNVKTGSSAEFGESSNIQAVAELSGKESDAGATKEGTAEETIGSKKGLIDGSGLGDWGTGKGKGYGFGDVDWGGGGNRWVLPGHKHLPKFPKNVRSSGTIKLRFYVEPDGTVSRIIPITRDNPQLERAAIAALKKWKFNEIKEEKVMVGIIPFTFQLR